MFQVCMLENCIVVWQGRQWLFVFVFYFCKWEFLGFEVVLEVKGGGVGVFFIGVEQDKVGFVLFQLYCIFFQLFVQFVEQLYFLDGFWKFVLLQNVIYGLVIVVMIGEDDMLGWQVLEVQVVGGYVVDVFQEGGKGFIVFQFFVIRVWCVFGALWDY